MGSVNWCDLEEELLMKIAEDHLISVKDFIMFSCVCRSWYHAAYACDKSTLRNTWTRQMPWLVLADSTFVDSLASRLGRTLPLTHQHDPHIDEDVVTINMSDDDDDDDEDEDMINEVDDDDVEISDDDNDNESEEAQKIRVIAIKGNTDNSDGRQDVGVGSEGISASTEKEKDGNMYSQRKILTREMCYDLSLPEAYNKVCWGSPYGWIVTLGSDQQMELINPLTKARLPLPSNETCRYSWKSVEGTRGTGGPFIIRRAVLLRKQGSWMVVVFHDIVGCFSLAKPGDKSWKQIRWPRGLNVHGFMDVLYHSDLQSLLFINFTGNLYYCDVRDTTKKLKLSKTYVRGPQLPATPTWRYIVQCNADLVLVSRKKRQRYGGAACYETHDFKLHKFDPLNKCWAELQALDGVALFVGNNVSLSIPAHEAGCRSNSIYFNDDCRPYYSITDGHRGQDIGVFDMATRTVLPFCNNNNRSLDSHSLWFSPAI